jgi:hypothetical protein
MCGFCLGSKETIRRRGEPHVFSDAPTYGASESVDAEYVLCEASAGAPGGAAAERRASGT